MAAAALHFPGRGGELSASQQAVSPSVQVTTVQYSTVDSTVQYSTVAQVAVPAVPVLHHAPLGAGVPPPEPDGGQLDQTHVRHGADEPRLAAGEAGAGALLPAGGCCGLC